MSATLGPILVKPTPSPSTTLPAFQGRVSDWTRQCEQSIRTIEAYLRANPSGGTGLPAGGTTGQVLEKNSGTDGDASWKGVFTGLTTDDLPQGSTNLYSSLSSILTAVSATAPLAYNNTTGVFSLPVATTSVNGYLSSVDWTTFNGKQNALGFTPATAARLINTTAPLTGGGDLTADRTLAMPAATTSVDGYLTHTDWNTFNSKLGSVSSGNLTEATSSVLTITGGTGSVLGSGTSIAVTKATGSVAGYLSAADWTTFNGKQAALTLGSFSEVTSSVLTITGGSGAVVGSGLTVAVTKADATHNGYLSSTDWSTFNGKQAALTTGNLTETTSSILTITGGTGAQIGSGTTIAVTKADATHSGYLSSTDWNTFNAASGGSVGRALMLCAAYTPSATGPDTAEVTVPYSTDGTTVLTWTVRRLILRVQTAGGAPAMTIEKSTGTGGFSASTVGTVTLSSGASEGANTTSLGTVQSGNKLRFNVGTLATASNWTIIVEISNP